MVFKSAPSIVGGCFQGGNPTNYDGSSLIEDAESDVIVVTVAFRLNIFGHLGGDAVKARSADGSAGNWGIQDQVGSCRYP